ncbi:unnamed protein product, partial [Mesorhabditis spiculigera]
MSPKAVIFLATVFFGTTAALNCSSSIGPCVSGSCSGLGPVGTVCTADGCCAGPNLIDGTTGREFICTGGSIGPCLSGACPNASDTTCVGVQVDGIGECCPGAAIAVVTTTSTTTRTTTATCVDLLNPVTGVSDCPKRASLLPEDLRILLFDFQLLVK